MRSPPARPEALAAATLRRDARGGGGVGAGGAPRRAPDGRPRRTPEERAAILARTPEEIAAIRAERAAKRMRLEAEQAALAGD